MMNILVFKFIKLSRCKSLFLFRNGGELDLMSKKVAATNGHLKQLFVDALEVADSKTQ